MDTTPCPKCGRGNPIGARFCTGCGAGLEAQASCPSCRTLQASGNQFCLSCGTRMPDASWQAPAADGQVIEGTWQRGSDEFVRRVDPEDTRTFLGSRIVRVPHGSVGVVVVEGRVERVLPPGEQTTLSLFERIRNFFTGKDGRTAFFLVDQRPVPVPFSVKVQAGGREVQAQVLVSFSVPRGDRDAIGTFLTRLMGDRAGFAAQDLHNLLRPEVMQLATNALDRTARGEAWTWNDAEGAIRAALAEQLGPKYGLSIEVSVAPPTAVASLDVHLGAVAAASSRTCEKCSAQVPASTRFCDRCGHKQPPIVASRPCGKCGTAVPNTNRFCEGCGAEVPAAAGGVALFTSDGEQIELDLVVRAQGRHEDFAAEKITPALAGVAAAHLRGVALSELVSGEGFTALEHALKQGAETALAAAGLQVSSISIIDVRSANGQWMLGARAELKRAKQEAQLGREWLAQQSAELDLQELTWAQALRRQRVERENKLGQLHIDLAAGRREAVIRADDAFGRESDALGDRQRRETLAQGAAELDRAQAQRDAARDVAVAEAKRSVTRADAAARREDELTGLSHDMKKEDLAFDHESALTRKAIGLESEKLRTRAQDEAFAATSRNDVAFTDHERRAKLEQQLKDSEELRQIEKLRAMAELDRAAAAQEHDHEFKLREALKGLSEREMIAIQATQLSKAEGGGAAWAQALSGQDAAKQVEQRLAEAEKHAANLQGVMKEQLDRLAQMTTAAVQAQATGAREGTAAEVFGRSLDAVSRVAASRAQPAPVVAGPAAACKSCGAALRADAKFCGACGSEQ